jgi:hypothetical protein
MGNLLWDPSGFIDDAAVAAVRSAGGLAFVTASHPHFYGAPDRIREIIYAAFDIHVLCRKCLHQVTIRATRLTLSRATRRFSEPREEFAQRAERGRIGAHAGRRVLRVKPA